MITGYEATHGHASAQHDHGIAQHDHGTSLGAEHQTHMLINGTEMTPGSTEAKAAVKGIKSKALQDGYVEVNGQHVDPNTVAGKRTLAQLDFEAQGFQAHRAEAMAQRV